MKAETQALINDVILSQKTSLHLQDLSLQLQDIEYLVKKCPQLTKLSISLGYKEWLDVLKFFPNLINFTLSGWHIYDDTMLKVHELQKLETLKIESEELYPDFFAGLNQLKNLKELAIIDCDYVRDESLELISKLTQLTSLEISRPSITQKGYGCLSNLINLTSLTLQYCRLKDDPLLFLHPLSNLKKLNLLGCHINNQSLQSLKSLKALTHLELECGWDLIDNKGIKIIAELPELQELNLEGCGVISNKSLQTLGLMPHLKSLRLENNREITPEGIATFKALKPNVRLSLKNCDVI